MFEAHRLIPRVGKVFPLSEAREAHALLEGRGKKPHGRIVLQVDGSSHSGGWVSRSTSKQWR